MLYEIQYKQIKNDFCI